MAGARLTVALDGRSGRHTVSRRFAALFFQAYRLLRRYRDGGASAGANQRRGRPSNNRLPDVVRDHAIALVRERYADF
jgi:hypothetical protein